MWTATIGQASGADHWPAGGATGVMAVAVLEYAESPEALVARTR